MSKECKITFEPSGRTVYALPGTVLFEAAARAGLILQSPCGGKGTCGKCRLRVAEGSCEPSPACRRAFTAEQLADGDRLACQARITSDCIVDAPDTSLFDSRSKILTSGDGDEITIQASVWKKYVELPSPAEGDGVADLKRLEREIGRVHVHLDVLRDLPVRLRDSDFKGTAVVCDCGSRLLDFEVGNTADQCYGVAFDVGTTTIVASLMDLTDGREVGVAAAMNPQVAAGDDVISRITKARELPKALESMQRDVVGTLNELVSELLERYEVTRGNVYEAVVAGNTTMQHLFCGISPAALGELPFPPTYNRALFLRAAEVGLDLHRNARLYVFPNVGGFVGGDTVAGVLATSLHETDRTVLFIDIGTNGEIVLAHDGQLRATSTAAGPAFEGARIATGMRAADGAIEKVVRRDGDIWYNVIGNAEPAGICGTALIDLVAEMLRFGVLDSTGRILSLDELPDGVPDAVRERLHPLDSHVNFLIAPAAESKTGEALYLYQKDVRELQLASAAIRAGVSIMLRQAGITEDEIDEVLLAGAFGNFIRRRNAQRIGLLPQIPRDKIRFVGNAASIGARAVLISREERQNADLVIEKVDHVDLSLDVEFQMEFGMAMLFPDGDVD